MFHGLDDQHQTHPNFSPTPLYLSTPQIRVIRALGPRPRLVPRPCRRNGNPRGSMLPTWPVFRRPLAGPLPVASRSCRLASFLSLPTGPLVDSLEKIRGKAVNGDPWSRRRTSRTARGTLAFVSGSTEKDCAAHRKPAVEMRPLCHHAPLDITARTRCPEHATCATGAGSRSIGSRSSDQQSSMTAST